ncbi:hypothetical protein FNV43_RR00123 [Rhamnella rubrinervis]|uniref:Disease resistance R13L4/SHOC-2-like LRR domain-containing protein n=1 Tax=Rhamnella rubrinervis TaxID=2594499 RepID=A0A8K0MRL8_9ROSA|nr:hypothetical protein FNV43_RR00123 [Rhamnella rubrinervis]
MLIFKSDLSDVTDLCETTFCATFKLLKVLDFCGAPYLKHLPGDIGALFHLKYLSVADTRVKELLSSIRKLQNLETLNLKGSMVQEVKSSQISRLHKLRHLVLTRGFGIGGIRLFKRFGCVALQKLYDVQFRDDIEELKKLTQLRKLSITGLRTTHEWSVVCECINEMRHLQSLRVGGIRGTLEDVDLGSISAPPELLQSLLLEIRVRKLPEWIIKLRNLVKFEIRASGLIDDPLEVLQHLPNLVVLIMADHPYDGEKLQFKQGMFQKLKHLELVCLFELNSLVIEEGALPTLELLILSFFPNLNTVPGGIQHMRNLKKLTLPIVFKNSVQPEGEDYHIVRHVPQVVFY